MKMSNVTFVINQMIALIEDRMESNQKHLISTETLKREVRKHLHLSAEGDDSNYCMETGFNHAISSRLYENGYRSVRKGYFVNLDRCKDVDYLMALSQNADLLSEEKAIVSARIREIKNSRCDGQYRWDLETGEIVEMLNEEQFMEKIVEDAV